MSDGILIIDKPVGFTSHDVVAKLRRILRTKKIGHTGTLDPFATGVLVMLVGKATRLAKFLDKDRKEYEAAMQFGFETDSGDLTGSPIADCGLRIEELAEILEKTNWDEIFDDFRGEIEQIPPMYSAKKVKGKKLYELARKGIEIEREPINVMIYELEIVENEKLKEEFEPQIFTDERGLKEDENLKIETDKIRNSHSAFRNQNSIIRIRVACSAGTYIRTLAEDIGGKVGVGAHLAALRRTKAGRFGLAQAVSLEELEKIVEAGKLGEILISMNEAISHLPEFVLNETDVKKVKNGGKIGFAADEMKDEQAMRLINENDDLIAVGFYNAERRFIQPRVVML